MTDPRTLNKHAALVSRMGDVVGVDFTQAKAKGLMSDTGWSETVTRCTKCANPQACQGFLAAQEAPEDREGVVAQAPDYCNNRLLMSRLRRLIDTDDRPIAAE
ncbi:DUF6455 family protein [Thioclava sp. GXIMD4216]|uniref:DUF6455 family protein n=1 Tax=Thioclava litoralis TaxID=3076557 RepID=A0ABZ1E3Y8_9RHOB|nr:DUF6455 family protein [Thioclava sp. FTW29]